MNNEDDHEWGLHGWWTTQEHPFTMQSPADGSFTVCIVGHACNVNGQRAITFVNVGPPTFICFGSAERVRACYEEIVRVLELENSLINYLIGAALLQATQHKQTEYADEWLSSCQRAVEKLSNMKPEAIRVLTEGAHRAQRIGPSLDSFAILGLRDIVT